MGYRGSTISKYDCARLLASALGYLLLQQRDATGLITYDTKVRDRFNPSANAHNFQRLTKMLEARQTCGETSMSKMFENILPGVGWTRVSINWKRSSLRRHRIPRRRRSDHMTGPGFSPETPASR